MHDSKNKKEDNNLADNTVQKTDSKHYVRAQYSKKTKIIIVIGIILFLVFVVAPIVINAAYGNLYPLLSSLGYVFAFTGPIIFITFLIVIIYRAVRRMK